MPTRRLPVCPNLDQLKHQDKDLLRALHSGDPAALAELQEHHSDPIPPSEAKLADAQLILARSYQAASWTRLVQAVELVDAIWRDAHPHEQQLGLPLTYAANLGRDCIIRMLHGLGATDLQSAIGCVKIAFFPGVNGQRFARELDRALGAIRECTRLIVDLRGDLGGFVGSLRLMTEGLGQKPFHGRVVMLVNEHTVSAGEMVAAFAAENGLARIVGTRTGGQVLAGGNLSVGHGFVLRFPAAGWYTWRGAIIEGKGVEPDVDVPLSAEGLRQGRDNQLETAIAAVEAMPRS